MAPRWPLTRTCASGSGASKKRAVFLELARKCDLLIPSLTEAEILTGLAEREPVLDELRALGPSQVVLKAGDQGAWYAEGDERGFCPCYPAVEIDPVGAGDAFCAGLLSGLLEGQLIARHPEWQMEHRRLLQSPASRWCASGNRLNGWPTASAAA
jgi:sugar/nucleoside kinase (ribokinase family)